MDYMKLTYELGANLQRYHKQQEGKAQRRHEKSLTKGTKRNYPLWQELAKEHYAERLIAKGYLRSLHLARGYCKGLDYKAIEQSVREGNEVQVEDILQHLNEYGYHPKTKDLRDWVAA